MTTDRIFCPLYTAGQLYKLITGNTHPKSSLLEMDQYVYDEIVGTDEIPDIDAIEEARIEMQEEFELNK